MKPCGVVQISIFRSSTAAGCGCGLGAVPGCALAGITIFPACAPPTSCHRQRGDNGQNGQSSHDTLQTLKVTQSASIPSPLSNRKSATQAAKYTFPVPNLILWTPVAQNDESPSR